MVEEIVQKKLEQVSDLLNQLEALVAAPFSEFSANVVAVRAAERNFQLIVDLASDANTSLLLERGQKTPDTYKESFDGLRKENIIPSPLAWELAKSAQLRNILVHEYDFEEDVEKFYHSVREFIPLYRDYVQTLVRHLHSRAI